MNIEINDDMADMIVKRALEDALRYVVNDINRLTELATTRDLKPYEKGDLGDNIALRVALNRVVQYYSTPDEFEAFARELAIEPIESC